MKFVRCLKMALKMLKHSKLRSWLTIIGIIIAVSSVTTILSFGQGIKTEVNNKLGDTGIDILNLYSGWSEEGSNELTIKDYETLKKLNEVDDVERIIRISKNTTYMGESVDIRYMGTDTDVFNKFYSTIEIIKGRELRSADEKVVLVDENDVNKTFDKKLRVGSMLEIDGQMFRVVGIYRNKDIFAGVSGFIMPLKDVQEFLRQEYQSIVLINPNFDANLPSGVNYEDMYHAMNIKVAKGYDVEDAKNTISQRLDKSRRSLSKDRPNYYLTGKDEALKSINTILDVITFVLVGFAGISVLVGSVGIANTMFTSVLEKTKEIGIMKAIGAKNKDILLIFLFNSGFLGLAGGLIGVIIGLLLALLGGYAIISATGVTGISVLSVVSFKIIFWALFFSMMIGMFSGLVPARNASKLKPVDALRY